MNLHKILAACAASLWLAGCVETTEAMLPNVAVRANLASPASTSTIPPELQARWWRLAHDPVLSGYIETALAENLSLKDIALRVGAAETARTTANGIFRPQTGTSESIRRETTTLSKASAAGASRFGKLATYGEGGLNASWELDLFGRGAGLQNIADSDLADAQANLASARSVVAADVFKAYVQARLAQDEMVTLGRAVAARRKLLSSVKSRAQSGLASEFDTARVETDLEHLEARLPAATAQLSENVAILAALRGEATPQPLKASSARAQLAAYQFTSIPADLLRRRPDVRQAANAILRAAGERDIAQADLYPRLYLKGDFALAPSLTSRSPSNVASAFGPVLTIPLFDRDLRQAQLSAREKILEATAFGYRDSVVTASTEVFRAVASLRAARAQAAQLSRAIASAHLAEQKSEDLYRGGLIGLNDRLAATLVATELELEAIDVRRTELNAIIAVLKSTGVPPEALAPTFQPS